MHLGPSHCSGGHECVQHSAGGRGAVTAGAPAPGTVAAPSTGAPRVAGSSLTDWKRRTHWPLMHTSAAYIARVVFGDNCW